MLRISLIFNEYSLVAFREERNIDSYNLLYIVILFLLTHNYRIRDSSFDFSGKGKVDPRNCHLLAKNVARCSVSAELQTYGGSHQDPAALPPLQDEDLHAGAEQSLQVGTFSLISLSTFIIYEFSFCFCDIF